MAALVEQTRLAATLIREPNSTLELPQEPYAFRTVNAFPGLTFNNPVALVSPPGETNRLFIAERAGRIQVITNLANPNSTLFLDIAGGVNPDGEGGLLGLAFHPGYRTNRFFYVFYTLNTSTEQGSGFHDRVARFEISPDNPNQALPNSEVPLITQFDDAWNHNAGDLHFGPDGYLYVSLGDEGNGGDSLGNSQRIDKDFFSAILRIDVDHRPGSLPPNPHLASSTNYAVPPDNPFVGATNFNGSAVFPNAVRTEFWAVGLRNPFRFSFDPMTGRLYCGDVGQDAREEIDLVVKGGNYGWNYREGAQFYTGDPPSGVNFLEPILDYAHGGGSSEGNCVIGGVVYHGTRIAALQGDYVFGDHMSGNIWALRYDGVTVSNFRHLTSLGGVCAFGQDPGNGDILMVQAAGAASVYRLVYTIDGGTSLPPTLADTGAFANLATLQPEPGIVPYDLNVPFWSDHARKTRWFSVPDPNDKVGFSSNGNWSFPEGTVWIKHFDLEMTNGVPESARRLETRFLVRNSSGVYGVTYRWDDSQANAFLVPEDGMDEPFLIYDEGTTRTQMWHYPARSECLTCHTPAGGLALGFNTFQLNRDHDFSGTVTNQILGINQMGYFTTSVTNVAGALAYAQASNEAATVEHRVRSYLGANCVQCHQPGGAGRGFWDARLTAPLTETGIINGALFDDGGDANNRVVKPGSLEHSMMLSRISDLGPRHMPPLATSELNQEAITLLARWITNDLAVFSVGLPAGHLAYKENDGPVGLDSGATITIAGGTQLAGGSLTIGFILNGAPEDRWGLRHVGNGNGEIGVSGNVVSYGGVTIGNFAGGTSGTDPLVVSFNTSVTSGSAQALLRHVTYENASQTPSTLVRTVRATLTNSDGSTSSQASMTIAVQSVPSIPVVVWNRPADIVYGTPLTEAQLNPSADVPGTFVFDPPIGRLLNSGNDQVLAATFTPQDPGNYISVTTSNLITVTKAPLAITADNKDKVYGLANPPLTASYTGFVNGDNSATLDTPVSLGTSATAASGVGAYVIMASGAADADYAIMHVNGTLAVTRAPLTITAEDKHRTFGLANPPLTASYAELVNGDVASSLDKSVSLTTTATPSSPVGSYLILASGAEDANYSIAHVNGTLTVTAQNVPELTLPSGNLAYTEGAGVVLLDAAATVTDPDSTDFNGGGLIVYFPTNGLTEDRLAIRNDGPGADRIGVSGNEIRYGGIVIGTFSGGTDGLTPLVVGFNANSTPASAQALIRNVTYENNSETPSTLTRTVRMSVDDGDAGGSAPASMTVSIISVPDDSHFTWVNPAPFVYGTALSSVQLNAKADVPGTFTYSPPAGTVLGAGTGQTLSAIFTPADPANFNSGNAGVTVNVSPAPLTITAENKAKAYGAALPAFTARYVGFVNGDAPSSLDAPVELSTAATVASGTGLYPIVASGAADANYAITHVNGTLTVTPAALTITAENRSKVYGAPLPALTAVYSGFVNGDTASALDTPLNLNTSATASSPAGEYPIVFSGAADSNYAISFVEGELTVSKAPLVVTADDQTKVYGGALPGLTAAYSGLVNGDTPADLDTPASLSTTATAGSPAGIYPITAGGASDANYVISHVNGTLSVTQAFLAITAENKTKAYGAAMPALTATYSDLVNGDTPSSLDTAVSLSTQATERSPAGVYPILATGASDANYTINFVNGTVTVSKAPLVITAEDKRKVFGQPNPALTARYGPFANGETVEDLDTPVSLRTEATTSSAVGSYPIFASGASDMNYEITLIDGILTIEPNVNVTSITLESGGQVRIRFTGLSGRAYRVEASGDLAIWSTAGTVQSGPNGEGEFLESAVSDGSTARFYRLVWP